MPPKQVCDQISQELAGVFESPLQGQELREHNKHTARKQRRNRLEMKMMNLNCF